MFYIPKILKLFILLFLVSLWGSFLTYSQDISFQSQADEPPSKDQSISKEKKRMISLNGEKFFYQFDFFMTYTQPVDPEFIPFRHSYFWSELFTGYQFNQNSSLVNTLRVSKVSMSNPVVLLPRDDRHTTQIMFFPTFQFEGSIREAFLKEGGDDHLSIEFGHLMSYTPSKGLIYSEMTIYGIDMNWDLTFGALDFSLISYGYEGFDDFLAFYIYTPKRYIGVGTAIEFNGTFGRRVLPEINAQVDFTFGNSQLSFFAEAIVPYLYEYLPLYSPDIVRVIRSSSCGQFIRSPYCNPDFNENIREIFLGKEGGRNLFSKTFTISKDTIATLGGFEWNYKNKKAFDSKISFRSEYRYYGKEYSDFYYTSRLIGFYFYTDVRTDEKYNNQPFNFFLYSGNNHNAYFKLEFEFNPLKAYVSDFLIKFRDEQILTWTMHSGLQGNTGNGFSYNNIFSLIFVFSPWKYLNLHFKISNILIGLIEATNVNPNTNIPLNQIDNKVIPRAPYLLESVEDKILLDIAVHFQI